MEEVFDFSERLHELMIEKTVGYRAVAMAINVDEETVRLWCKGKRKIRLSKFVSLADYFNCSLEFLSGRTERYLDYTKKSPPNFHERLLAVLAVTHKTQSALIKETGIYSSYFTNWKKGADPQVLTLVKICRALDCSLDYLVGLED